MPTRLRIDMVGYHQKAIFISIKNAKSGDWTAGVLRQTWMISLFFLRNHTIILQKLKLILKAILGR